ncbi:MAG TPA: hypothetical protein VKQ30_20610 [Ktedonobacterales bacterium]|nr:hypothetical protein [Ktedonobacterales bacterium]
MNTHVNPPPTPDTTVDIKTRIDQFLAIRDKISEIEKQHKDFLSPYKLAKEQLEGILLAYLQAAGLDSIAGSSGTAYRNTKRSATIADPEAFRQFVQANAAWDLADWRANAPAVHDFITENGGVPPPGVNYTELIAIGVRKK